jgi:hypothetical protein
MNDGAKTMLRIKSLLLLSVLVFVTRLPLTAATVTYGVGACGQVGLTSFLTISGALAATPAPSVIKVCPGTYPEQVVITIPVTIEGVLIDGAGLASITVPPGGLRSNATDEFGDPVFAQVWVDNVTGPVNISNIAVSASDNGVGDSGENDSTIAGVFYENTSGTLNNLEARFQEGNGSGVGIWVEGGSANPTVTVENSNTHDFDQSGIFADGGTDTLTAKIENNSIIGVSVGNAGSLCIVGQVFLTASGNFINSPTGIFIGSGQGFLDTTGAPTGSVSNNTVTGGANGIVVGQSSELSVTSNKIYYISGPGIQLFSPVTVQHNLISQATNGIDFGCTVDNNVSLNTLTAIHSDGLIHVPTSVTSTNAYFNVPTIRSGGC